MKRKRLHIALTILGVIVLVEVVSYGVVRALAKQSHVVRADTHLFDAHRNHRLNPQFRFSDARKSRIHSPGGFRRDTPVSVDKPEGTLRIIAMGTSALYGIGAGAQYPYHRPLFNDETITYFLEKRIRERLRSDGIDFDVEVVNAGVSAYKTFHQLVYLNSDLLDFSPDIVINIDGHNDFYADTPTDRWNTYAYSTSILVDEFNGRTFFLPFFTFTRALAPYSNFFNLVERLCKRAWYATRVEKELRHTPHRTFTVSNDSRSNVREVARRGYLRDLWQIHNLSKHEGFDHYVFLQPEIVFESNELLSESDKRLQEITLNVAGGNAVEEMKKIRMMLPSLFKEQDIPFFDTSELSPSNRREEDLYIDYCHLTPAGSKIAAEGILEILYPRIVAKIESLSSTVEEAPAKE